MTILEKHDIINAALPAKTHSYTPVSNRQLLETIEEKLYKHNLPIINERFNGNGNMNQMFGVYTIGMGNGEQQMNIGFRNSYDKSLAVGLVAGATVIVCSNLMFKGDIKMLRKHTNGVFNDLSDMIEKVIGTTEIEFEEIQDDTQHMKSLPMSRQFMAETAGRMFINDSIINATQMGIIKREINFSDKFRELSKWDFYNHCTEAMKVSHPSEVMQSHIKLHNYIMEVV